MGSLSPAERGLVHGWGAQRSLRAFGRLQAQTSRRQPHWGHDRLYQPC